MSSNVIFINVYAQAQTRFKNQKTLFVLLVGYITRILIIRKAAKHCNVNENKIVEGATACLIKTTEVHNLTTFKSTTDFLMHHK